MVHRVNPVLLCPHQRKMHQSGWLNATWKLGKEWWKFFTYMELWHRTEGKWVYGFFSNSVTFKRKLRNLLTGTKTVPEVRMVACSYELMLTRGKWFPVHWQVFILLLCKSLLKPDSFFGIPSTILCHCKGSRDVTCIVEIVRCSCLFSPADGCRFLQLTVQAARSGGERQ